MEKDARPDDISAQMLLGEGKRSAKPPAKPGILLNAQFEIESKQFKKTTKSLPEEGRQRQNDEDYQVSEEEESPGEDEEEESQAQ